MNGDWPEGFMAEVERFLRETHPALAPGAVAAYPEVFATGTFFPLQRPKELTAMLQKAWAVDPVTVMEIGADKGGSLYHWCQSLPTVRNVLACELRGLPYRDLFEAAFPYIRFCWFEGSSLGGQCRDRVGRFLGADRIDALFIDGAKHRMLADFDAYLPLMRRPGGVAFLHDVSDDEPFAAFRALMTRGYRTELILDRSEGLEAAERYHRGEPPRNSHDQWLMQWGGRSCGVGVVYL